MRKLLVSVLFVCVTAAPVSAVLAQAAGPFTPDRSDAAVSFRARQKFTQDTSRLLQIHVDASAMPLDSDTLTTLVNSGPVAGRAAKAVFGLDEDRYGAYIDIQVKASKGARSITARLDMTIRADQRVPEDYFTRFTEHVRDHLRVAIAETVRLDEAQLALVKGQLQTRRASVENEMSQVRAQRIELTIKAGLAELGYEDSRSLVAAYMKLKREFEMDLAAKKARLKEMEKKVSEKGSLNETDPMDDPIVKQLQRLVDMNQKRLDSLSSSKYATTEDLERGQAALIDAATRVAERIESLEMNSPHRQLELLEYDIAELEAKVEYCENTVGDAKVMARDMYVSQEDIELLRESEMRMRTRLSKLDGEIANIEDTTDRLQFVTVNILGYAQNSPAPTIE